MSKKIVKTQWLCRDTAMRSVPPLSALLFTITGQTGLLAARKCTCCND